MWKAILPRKSAPTRKEDSASHDGIKVKRSSLSVNCPSLPPLPASRLRARARSWPRVKERIAIREVQMHSTNKMTPVRAEILTIASTARGGAEDDATSATAMPEAVTSVFATSTYIVRLASVVQFHPRFFASCQNV